MTLRKRLGPATSSGLSLSSASSVNSSDSSSSETTQRGRHARSSSDGLERERVQHGLAEDSDSSFYRDEGTPGSRAKRVAARKGARREMGVTLNGLRVFAIPETYSPFESLFVHWRSLPSLLALTCMLLSLVVAVVIFPETPSASLAVAVAWRLAYNLGIGWLLKRQSDAGLLTGLMTRVRQRPFSETNELTSDVLRRTMPNDREVVNDHTLPAAFPAWVAFRAVVNIVESNDVFAFTLMAWCYGRRDRAGDAAQWWPALSLVADLVGLLLIGASLYSKMSAKAQAGDYAWYWGDFFFLRTGAAELSYAGVFELFPHPMYTVGYGWTYGTALLSRSLQVLAAAMAVHFSQMVFLALVETPHVDRLYGSRRSSSGTERRQQELEGAASATGAAVPPPPAVAGLASPLATMGGSLFLLRQFDAFEAADLLLLLSVGFYASTVSLGSFPGGPLDDDAAFIALAIGARVMATFVKAGVLVGQERTKFWTRHFARRGLSRSEAFANWKRLMRLLQSLENTAFLQCVARLASAPTDGGSLFLCRVLLALMLGLVSLWSHASCHEVLGDYGWFYGDFFLPPNRAGAGTAPVRTPSGGSGTGNAKKRVPSAASVISAPVLAATVETVDEDGPPLLAVPPTAAAAAAPTAETLQQPTYEGIYRYLNNPDAYLGHLWMYALALLSSSYEVMLVAILAHALKVAFLNAIEKPHFRAVYKQHVRKSSTALGRAIRSKFSDIRRSETALFLANWVKHPIETGALAPSSEQLAVAMCETMHLGEGAVVVELGPGTGPFTREILQRMSNHATGTYLAFELSDEFVKRLRATFPAHAYADTVISGLPWAIFPRELQQSILKQVYAALKPGGRFCTFAYLQGLVLPAGQNFKALLDRTFDKVERSPIVWANLPPAFVYRCEKTK